MSVGRFNAGHAAALGLGLAFLWVPIGRVVAFSFNASRLATVWGGFSTEPYASLWTNGPLWTALAASLRVAAVSAAIATVLGTLAAVALVRAGRFAGRRLFLGLVYAPMALPEVVTGLSLLLLFVALGWDRGLWTVTVAHATLTLSFATVVVQSRLVGMDPTLEEAAIDLGATPLVAFLTVTLPLLAPAVAAAFLLAFTLSLDDLVLASFTSGPGSTTLPMLIFGQVRRGVTPEINAVATMLIAAVALAILGGAIARKVRGRSGP